MVRHTYYGLGGQESAVREFEGLTAYAADLVALRGDCEAGDLDDAALGIAFDGLETAAYHFTRRRNFYHVVEAGLVRRQGGNGRLGERAEAVSAFQGLSPHVVKIRGLMSRCRPFGRDYLALKISIDSLETAAFHFTRVAAFYSAKADSAGPVRGAP